MAPSSIPSLVPHGRTARRLAWRFLPVHVRRLVEQRCGSPVVEAISQGGGFTPAFASVLVCADGSRHFVKAASVQAQRAFAGSYRAEARTLAALPDGVPAPALRWVHEDDEWVVLGLEHVEARTPGRPWDTADLARCVDALEQVAGALTPPPGRLLSGSGPAALADDLAAAPGYWEVPRVAAVAFPLLAERREQAARLAAGFGAATAGSTLVRTEVRDDNLLLASDGRTLVCDWAWPALGAAWVDTVLLMIGPRGDGLDVDEALAGARVTRDVRPSDVDALLALVTGMFLHSATMPVPTTSPHVREAQRWQGEVCWAWLCERRGWR